MSDQSPIQTATLATQRYPKWRRAAVERLEELIRLEHGWDGYRGVPVSLEIALFALRLLEAVCQPETPETQIVPGSGGSVQIEWHEHGFDIELFVRAPNDVEAWRSIVGGNPEGEQLELISDFTVVSQWLSELTERALAT